MNLRIFLLMILLTGCSIYKVGYSYGDWLLEKRITKYLKLEDIEKRKLKETLDTYMSFHYKVLIPKYISELRNVRDIIVEKKSIDWTKYLSNFYNLYARTGYELSKRISPFLLNLNQAQIEVIRRRIIKDNDSLKKDYERKNYIDLKKNSFFDLCEDWLGMVSLDQKKIIEIWIKDNIDIIKNDFSFKLNKQNNFFILLETEKLSLKKLDEFIFGIFYPGESTNYFRYNEKQKLLELYSKVLTKMNEVQRAFLKQKIKKSINVLKSL